MDKSETQLRHDLRNNLRKQEIILDLITRAMKEGQNIDPIFLQDMDRAVEEISKDWEQLKRFIGNPFTKDY